MRCTDENQPVPAHIFDQRSGRTKIEHRAAAHYCHGDDRSAPLCGARGLCLCCRCCNAQPTLDTISFGRRQNRRKRLCPDLRLFSGERAILSHKPLSSPVGTDIYLFHSLVRRVRAFGSAAIQLEGTCHPLPSGYIFPVVVCKRLLRVIPALAIFQPAADLF